jgi:hypothetical protein
MTETLLLIVGELDTRYFPNARSANASSSLATRTHKAASMKAAETMSVDDRVKLLFAIHMAKSACYENAAKHAKTFKIDAKAIEKKTKPAAEKPGRKRSPR